MVSQQEEALRLLLEKYNEAAIRGAQSAGDKETLDSPETAFNRDTMVWVNNVVLGLDPSFRLRQVESEYSPETAKEVGEFLREAWSSGLAGFNYAGMEHISRKHDQRITKDYVPLENIVNEATKGLKLEGRIMLQIREQLKNELSELAGVMHVWDFATRKEGLYVNWRATDGMRSTAERMLGTAKRVVGERAAKQLYEQRDYAAVQQLLPDIDSSGDAELLFIRASSSYRLALEVPTSNRKRQMSLGLLKKAITKYVMFLQRHPQGIPGFEAEFEEDMRKGGEFVAQLRQQNQPKDYVRKVEAVLRDSEFRKYTPHPLHPYT